MHFPLFTVLLSLYDVVISLYYVHLSLYEVLPTLYEVLLTLYAVVLTLYAVNTTLYYVLLTLHTVYSLLYVVFLLLWWWWTLNIMSGPVSIPCGRFYISLWFRHSIICCAFIFMMMIFRKLIFGNSLEYKRRVFSMTNHLIKSVYVRLGLGTTSL